MWAYNGFIERPPFLSAGQACQNERLRGALPQAKPRLSNLFISDSMVNDIENSGPRIVGGALTAVCPAPNIQTLPTALEVPSLERKFRLL
jgi:hypothetical protein